MLKSELFCRLAAASILAVVGLTGASAPAADGYRTQSPGITNPSDQRGLNFNVPGVVSQVMVKEGDIVKKGDVVAQQDDSVEQADLLVKEADQKNAALQIDAAKADLEQKKVELKRSQKMSDQKVLGESELEKAKLDVVIGQIRVTLAEQETEQKKLEADAEKAKIAQKKLIATIDGIVQKINVHAGELATNDPKTPCMMIVLNEPLYVEVDVPIGIAGSLALKQKIDVRYAGDQPWLSGELIYFNPVANAAAGTQRIRLQLDNPNHMRSGLQVEVKLGEKVAVAHPAR
ncbi:MAG TPA: efflux RND transporter periplasmic adaptor subunit [Tepidisphaeraceae bacterium]|jgi:RND family efflux transporter MFP subunit|nr:efflux RND transporter periplasmic adaptor subunit [Tepidisphaeraceae bacterium]